MNYQTYQKKIRDRRHDGKKTTRREAEIAWARDWMRTLHHDPLKKIRGNVKFNHQSRVCSAIEKYFRYRMAEGSWAGGENYFSVDFTKSGETPSITATTSTAWSRNGKWRGSNAHFKIIVPSSWLRTVKSQGLTEIDGLLTLSATPIIEGLAEGEAAWNATWGQQSTGFNVKTVSGIIFKKGENFIHAKSISAGRAGLTRRAKAEKLMRSQRRLTRLIERIGWPQILTLTPSLKITYADAIRAGNCKTGIASFQAQYGNADSAPAAAFLAAWPLIEKSSRKNAIINTLKMALIRHAIS